MTTPPILTYRPSGSGLHVDLDRLVASRMLIQANSGGGKSRALRQLLEETHGRVQHFVIDPEGEFATLREKFDYVLAAKSGGDVQATPKTARLLCRRLVELGASAVLDLLIEARTEGIEKEDLARQSGQSPLSSGFRANLSTLSALGLIRRESGAIVVSDLLFPKGLV